MNGTLQFMLLLLAIICFEAMVIAILLPARNQLRRDNEKLIATVKKLQEEKL